MINLDTFASDATRALEAQRPELEERIEKTRADAEQSALMKPKAEVLDTLAEDFHWHMMPSTPAADVAARYAEKHVERHSAAYAALDLLHKANEADRVMADLINDMIGECRRAQDILRRHLNELQLGQHLTGSQMLADHPSVWHLSTFAAKVSMRYEEGAEFREAVRHYFAESTDIVLAYPDTVFSNGSGPDSMRVDALARARAGSEFIRKVGEAYAGDPTMVFTMADMVPPPF